MMELWTDSDAVDTDGRMDGGVEDDGDRGLGTRLATRLPRLAPFTLFLPKTSTRHVIHDFRVDKDTIGEGEEGRTHHLRRRFLPIFSR